ncbi:MAG: hypothetical protein KBC73_14105 [Burkholderiaceae bacterium]|nr:hypothetical protein [Burkholderiaceae bacterium]
MPNLLLILGLVVAGLSAPAAAGEFSDEFDRQRYKDGFQHEIAFREAAIHVAWGAESLCDDTSEIEPFVLWSTRTVRKGLSAHHEKLFKQATGMDEHWRIAWLDEAAPEELKIGTRVVAVNKRPLPAPGAKFELAAVFRGGSTMSVDDQAFWAVMHKAREEANDGQQMTLTLDGGRDIQVSTQTGCAGTVMASAFDDEPGNFLRQEGRRSKIPGNAMLEARSRDEQRWLAAFGTYFLASERSILRQRSSDDVGNAFMIGKVLALAVPGGGTILSAVEAQTQRSIQVDGLVGGADLFANEVVMAMGGDPSVGLKLSDRLKAKGVPADVLVLSEFRRSTVELHLRSLRDIDQARKKADEAAERAELAGGSAATPATAAGAASAPRPAASR